MDVLNSFLNKKFSNNSKEILEKVLPFIGDAKDELLNYKISLVINSIENNYFNYSLKTIENIYQLNLNKWDIYINQEKRIEEMKNIKTETSDIFKCSKCHHTKTIYTTAQIRSGDEGTTVFITCINCHHKWKQ